MTEGEKRYQVEVRCPKHQKLLGKYDGRIGCSNVTYFCRLCKQEYTFTFPAKKFTKNA
jgi:hypothetical protein